MGALDRLNSCLGWLTRLALWGFFGVLLLIDLAAGRLEPESFALAAAGIVAATGVLLRRRRTIAWAIAACAVSATVTVLFHLGNVYSGREYGPIFGAAELAGLLGLTVLVLRRADRRRLAALVIMLAVTIVVVIPLRDPSTRALFFATFFAVLVTGAVGVGAQLRYQDEKRVRALGDVRRAERLELARDLHDFVAHHVTGIVVQTQAVRYAAQSGVAQDPAKLDTMLARIENAGSEALTSMRQLVGVLREAQEAATRPTGDLGQVTDLVEEFSRTGPPVELHIAAGDLSPQVAASVFRIVQEGLTNVRKHAADAGLVRVTVRRLADGIEVAVRDDGRGTGRRLPRSGFGLAGLTERVEALHGHLHAAPRPEGGFELVAVLPAP